MPQIKISIPEKIYKQLKNDAEKNYRTLGAEVAFITEQHFGQSTPVSIPVSIPTSIQPPFIPTSTSTSEVTPEPAITPVKRQKTIPTLQPEPDNEWYKKVKKYYADLYGKNSKEWQELLELAAHPNVKTFLKTNHAFEVKTAITGGYGTTLSPYEFEDILDYLAGRDPDARNI